MPLLAFHGFGESLDTFKSLSQSLCKHYRVIGVNLFLHGNSAYPSSRINKQTLTKPELAAIFEAFLDELQIARTSLAGYSMGGKIALCLLEQMPERTVSAYLLAPDGIKQNGWYRIASNTMVGRRLYRGTVKNPNPALRLAQLLTRANILHEKTLKLVRNNLATAEHRQLVYDVWVAMRKLNPDLKQIGKQMQQNQTHVHLIFGKYDNVIPPVLAQRFTQLAGEPSSLHVLNCGHRLLNPETDAVLESVILGANGQ